MTRHTRHTLLNVTGSEKTRHIHQSMNFQLAVYLDRAKSEIVACLAVEPQHFVFDCATPSIMEKLRSKGVAMHACGVSIYYA